jgi:hypothetical protein
VHISAFGADEIIGKLHIKNRTERTVEVRTLAGKGCIAAKEALKRFSINLITAWFDTK